MAADLGNTAAAARTMSASLGHPSMPDRRADLADRRLLW